MSGVADIAEYRRMRVRKALLYKRPSIPDAIAIRFIPSVTDQSRLSLTASLLFILLGQVPIKMFSSRLIFVFSLLSSLVAAQTCQLQFDGRVPADLAAADFDAPNDIFSETFVLGQGWSGRMSVGASSSHYIDRSHLQPGVAAAACRCRLISKNRLSSVLCLGLG